MSERIHLKHEPLAMAAVWMTLATLVLFWAPFLNGVVAGAIGGWRAGHVGRAILASLIAIAVVSLMAVIGFDVFGVPELYIGYRLRLWGWDATSFAGMLVGAIPAAIARRYGGTREVVPVRATRGRGYYREPLSGRVR